MHKQALGFPRHLIPMSMPWASSVRAGCSSCLLPLSDFPGIHPSYPILCTSFLPGRWAQPLCHLPLGISGLVQGGHPFPSRVLPPPHPGLNPSSRPLSLTSYCSGNGGSWTLVSLSTCSLTRQYCPLPSLPLPSRAQVLYSGKCSVEWGSLDSRPSLDSES